MKPRERQVLDRLLPSLGRKRRELEELRALGELADRAKCVMRQDGNELELVCQTCEAIERLELDERGSVPLEALKCCLEAHQHETSATFSKGGTS